ETALDRLALVGWDGGETSIPLLEPIAHELDRLNFLVAVERDWRHEEAKPDGHGLARGLARGEIAQDLHVATSIGVVLERGLAHRVQLQLGGLDDDVRAGEAAELLQLRGCPGRLGRAAAADDDNVANRRAADRLD